MKLDNFVIWITNYVKNSIKVRSLPLGLAGLLVGILSHFTGNTIVNQAGLFSWLVSPLTYVALIVATLVSIFMMHQNKWKCTCHDKKILRYIHTFGAFLTGISVSFFSYLTTVLTVFFTDVNILSGGQINNSIEFIRVVNNFIPFTPLKDVVWIIPLFSIPYLFMLQDMFDSYDNKSGIIFGNHGPFAKGIRWMIKKAGIKF